MKVGLIAAAALFLTVPSVANAGPITNWNVQGSWEIGYVCENCTYSIPVNITTEDFNTGLFTATGPGNDPVSGQVAGSAIEFEWLNNGFYGNIYADGTMGGSMISYQATQWHGNFWTESGQAVATPEPATMGLLAVGVAALVVRRRRAGK